MFPSCKNYFSLVIDKYGFTKSFEDRPSNVRNGIRLSNGSGFEVDIKVSKDFQFFQF